METVRGTDSRDDNLSIGLYSQIRGRSRVANKRLSSARAEFSLPELPDLFHWWLPGPHLPRAIHHRNPRQASRCAKFLEKFGSSGEAAADHAANAPSGCTLRGPKRKQWIDNVAQAFSDSGCGSVGFNSEAPCLGIPVNGLASPKQRDRGNARQTEQADEG